MLNDLVFLADAPECVYFRHLSQKFLPVPLSETAEHNQLTTVSSLAPGAFLLFPFSVLVCPPAPVPGIPHQGRQPQNLLDGFLLGVPDEPAGVDEDDVRCPGFLHSLEPLRKKRLLKVGGINGVLGAAKSGDAELHVRDSDLFRKPLGLSPAPKALIDKYVAGQG